MKQFLSHLLRLLMCAALAGCGNSRVLEGPLPPEPRLEKEAVSDRSGETVLLRGRFVGGGAHFSGNFTHLGRFKGVFDALMGTAVWTAADGATVTNQTTSFVFGKEVSPGVFRYTQELNLTGGTGRFADASGRATVTGLYDLNTGAYDGQLEGCIARLGDR